MEGTRVKIVVVGDGACGKTCILHVYKNNSYPEVHVPTVVEIFTERTVIDNKEVELVFWDTAGQEDYERLRPLSYPQTDVFIVVYSIDDDASLENVVQKWKPELRHFAPKVPIVLAGNKIDLRNEIDTRELLTPHRGKEVANKIGAVTFMECSAKLNENIKDLVLTAARIGLLNKNKKIKKKQCNIL